MRGKMILLFCAMLTFIFSAPVYADFYKWVDRDGREFYTNELEKIPREYRASARPVEVSEDRISVDNSPAGHEISPGRSSEHKDKYGKGEEYWRRRAENLRRQIREKEDDYDLLVEQEQEDAQKTGRSSSRSKKKTARQKKMAALEKKIARLRRELDAELPEEARKADAYPGWLRE